MGARVVNVHGETVSEPVEPGTNLAAAGSAHVDILAHPGLIKPEEASIAAGSGVFLEVSARRSHAFANGHVVKTAREAGARMVLDSDAHEPGDLMTREFAMKVALGAGLGSDDAVELLDVAPTLLLEKVGVPEPM
jgi:histidinol phosphatase-like PHP family hydrolase